MSNLQPGNHGGNPPAEQPRIIDGCDYPDEPGWEWAISTSLEDIDDTLCLACHRLTVYDGYCVGCGTNGAAVYPMEPDDCNHYDCGHCRCGSDDCHGHHGHDPDPGPDPGPDPDREMLADPIPENMPAEIPGKPLPGTTNPEGWPVAIPDDRKAVAAGDTIPLPQPPDLFGLFYSGLTNMITGSPDTGKTYFVLAAARDAHVSGRLLWLDAEDTAETFSRRCLQLSCPELTTSADVRRVNHSDWIAAEPEDLQASFEWLSQGFGPGLIVIDSGTGSGTGDSLDQWTAWMHKHLPDRKTGVGSILIMHPVKNPEDRHGQSGGSRAILGLIRGMALLIDELEGTGWAPATDTTPPQPGGYGFTCSKNKPGGLGWTRNTRIGTLHGDPHNDGKLTLTVQVGSQARTLPDAVARYVAKNPGERTTTVCEHITGDKKARSAAVIKAEKDGLIIRIVGDNGAKLCYPPDHPDTPTSE